jgi:transmembrane sensor
MNRLDHEDLGTLAARVALHQDRVLADESLPSTDALLAGIGRRKRAAARTRAFGAVAVGVLVVAIGFAVVRPPRATGVAIATSPAMLEPSLGTTSAEEKSVALAFRDGTRMVVGRQAKIDLKEIRPHGASLAIEKGTLNVDVVHQDDSRWNIVAGPFGILVTGTKFDATWDPASNQLTIAMFEGTVRVSGPCVDEALPAPETRVYRCPPDRRPQPGPASTPQPSDPTPKKPGAALGGNSPSTVGRTTPAPSPIPRVPDDAPSTEAVACGSLLAQADEARIAGDRARASSLYLQLRSQFPGTEAASRSAFLLGRAAQSSGALDEAARWFETAVREGSGLAEEALGRLLELEQARGNAPRAHKLSLDYLQRFPNGPHAAYARSLIDAN